MTRIEWRSHRAAAFRIRGSGSSPIQLTRLESMTKRPASQACRTSSSFATSDTMCYPLRYRPDRFVPAAAYSRAAMAKHTIVLIPGDGIGPEVTARDQARPRGGGAVGRMGRAARRGHRARAGVRQRPARSARWRRSRRTRSRSRGRSPRRSARGSQSVNVQLRKKLNLYAAVRPVRSLPGIKTRFENVDLVIVRENTEGLYSGIENEVVPGVVTSLKVASEAACTRIARYAFRYATRRHRKKITVFHKANIMKLTDGLFLDCARKIHEEEYPNIEYEEVIIDAGCMKLVQDPTRFDVLLMENLYGDLVSDLCAGLVGGLGVVPGSNIGDDAAVFEAVHGSAPDIAGKGVANPLALIMSGVMMLNHIHEEAIAQKIKRLRPAPPGRQRPHPRPGRHRRHEQFTDALIAKLR